MKRKNISIGVFEPVAELTGGKAYRELMCDLLSKRFDVEVFRLTGGHRVIPSIRLRRMMAIAKVKKSKDVWIRDYYPVVGMSIRKNPGKNIVLFHHMYTEGEESDLLGRALAKFFLRNVRKCDRVVTVAHFWRDYFAGIGLRNVRVIRNAMNPEEFRFQPEEIEAFKRKYSLTGANVVYIGNCRRNKGVIEAYEALKDRGYCLVTSGEPDVHLPCPNFNLPYREYLLLLKASSVAVTLSKFREGWCRTAHEAMLCKIPVIGSGMGGMRELLEEGKQYTCRDISELPHMVEAAIKQGEKVGGDGYNFVSTLTLERFEKEWSDLIEEVVRNEPQPE